jgi:DNA-binding transcriptional LysR family regulator
MPRRTNLEIDVLRTFVTGVQLGSFARAANQLGRSPSAVSAQLRKLEDQIEQDLFRRAGRGLALTDAGEALLGYAQRIIALNDETIATLKDSALEGWVRLGLPQDFAELWLPAALGRFARTHPKVNVEVHVERNVDLLRRVEAGELDLVLAWGTPDTPGDGKPMFEVPMVWVGPESRSVDVTSDPLLVAAFEPPCVFRAAGTAALTAAGRPWRITFTSPSLSGLWAAVEAGLGITIRTPLGLPPSLAILDSSTALPALPSATIVMHTSKVVQSPIVGILGEILEDTLAEVARQNGNAMMAARPESGSSNNIENGLDDIYPPKQHPPAFR